MNRNTLMRALLRVCSFSLVAAYGVAYAQSDAKPESATSPPKVSAPTAVPKSGRVDADDEIRARGKAWFTQCMQDWDSTTHMTKKDWERTCRRVTLERTKFLIDQGKK